MPTAAPYLRRKRRVAVSRKLPFNFLLKQMEKCLGQESAMVIDERTNYTLETDDDRITLGIRVECTFDKNAVPADEFSDAAGFVQGMIDGYMGLGQGETNRVSLH